MMPRSRWLALLLCAVAVVAAASCGGDDEDERQDEPPSEAEGAAGETETPAATADATPALTPVGQGTVTPSPTASPSATPETVAAPDQPGPYSAGVTVLTFTRPSTTSGEPRVIETVVWYPTERVLPYDDFLKGARDVDVAPGGPFPMLVFSHGSGGNTLQSTFLTSHLASHGFIVAAVSHTGDTTSDCFPCADQEQLADSYVNRPVDATFVRDQMILTNGFDDATLLSGAIDRERLGVFGHSFGGFTSLATLAADAFDAGAVLAPVRIALPTGRYSEIDVPLLVMGGGLDNTTPFTMQETIYEESDGTETKILVQLPRAGHLNFTDYCLEGSPGCGPEGIAMDEAHRLVNLYVTAFFRYFLNGDEAYGSYLGQSFPPEAVVAASSGVDSG
ncbi:MAG: prolyl oligopeptidase family serine peptidase [Dehalococcoidia bacterium]|nr:prolyl oligopeptidase family serine peptidase [Dehalococcoidia bacterium]